MLISFEGGEGAGKSTLIHRLYHHLLPLEKPLLLTRAPGSTSVGELLRELLLNPEEKPLSLPAELFLFLADRAEHVDKVIRPALLQKTVVLCDRFNDSTAAYQGGARGFGVKWIQTLCDFATQGLQPDLTFYLDIEPSLGLSRVMRSKDRLEQEKLTFHEEVRNTYLSIAQQEPKRFYILDGSQSPDELFQTALRILIPYWEC
ncbi:dTMP kinase [Rhabdochlamydiaceae symbiont of Dictyostelium giganteum]|uniref:dTMP kinase n=1 Tax=Rhabdochlamydiaceae symbiont of Dictyostelium giganteum TaxID=3342349 RepID=UPI00384C2DDB